MISETTNLALDEIHRLTELIVEQKGQILRGQLRPDDAALSDGEAAQIAAELPHVAHNEIRWGLQHLLAVHEQLGIAARARKVMDILASSAPLQITAQDRRRIIARAGRLVRAIEAICDG